MALDSGLCKMRNFFERNANGVFELVGKRTETAAEHDCGRDLVRIFRSDEISGLGRFLIGHKVKIA